MQIQVILENMQFEQKSVGTAYAGAIAKAMEYVNMPEGLITMLWVFPSCEKNCNFKILVRGEYTLDLIDIFGTISMSEDVTVYVDRIDRLQKGESYNLHDFKMLVKELANRKPNISPYL